MEREGLLAHAATVGTYFEERLQSLADLQNSIGRVREIERMSDVVCDVDEVAQ